MERYTLKEIESFVKSKGPLLIWDRINKEFVEYDGGVEFIWFAPSHCNRLNDDFSLYNKAISEFVEDTPIECPNCHTENYHFKENYFCCAFC